MMKKLSLISATFMLMSILATVTIAMASTGSISTVGNGNITHVKNSVTSAIGDNNITHVENSDNEGTSSDGWKDGNVLIGCTEIHENLDVENLEVHASTKITVRGNLSADNIKMYQGNEIIVHGNLAVENLELHEGNNVIVLGNADIGNLEMHGDDRMIVHGNITAERFEDGVGSLIVLGNATVGSVDVEGKSSEKISSNNPDNSWLHEIRNGDPISEVEETLVAYKEAITESNTYAVKLQGADQTLTIRKPVDLQVDIDMSETVDSTVLVEDIEDSGEDRIFLDLNGTAGILTIERPVNRQVTIDAGETKDVTIFVNTKDPVTKPAYIIDETVIDVAGTENPRVFIDSEIIH